MELLFQQLKSLQAFSFAYGVPQKHPGPSATTFTSRSSASVAHRLFFASRTPIMFYVRIVGLWDRFDLLKNEAMAVSGSVADRMRSLLLVVRRLSFHNHPPMKHYGTCIPTPIICSFIRQSIVELIRRSAESQINYLTFPNCPHRLESSREPTTEPNADGWM